jgi:hypothetical protein
MKQLKLNKKCKVQSDTTAQILTTRINRQNMPTELASTDNSVPVKCNTSRLTLITCVITVCCAVKMCITFPRRFPYKYKPLEDCFITLCVCTGTPPTESPAELTYSHSGTGNYKESDAIYYLTEMRVSNPNLAIALNDTHLHLSSAPPAAGWRLRSPQFWQALSFPSSPEEHNAVWYLDEWCHSHGSSAQPPVSAACSDCNNKQLQTSGFRCGVNLQCGLLGCDEVQKFSTYLKENNTSAHKHEIVNAFYRNNYCYYENHVKSINILCRQNAFTDF